MRGLRGEARKVWAFLREDSGLSVLLPVLVLTFLASPIIGGEAARVLGAVAFSVVFVAGTANLSGRGTARWPAIVVVVVAILLRWLEQFIASPALARASTAAALLFCVLLTAQVLRRVFRDGAVTTHRVQGAVAAYFLFGVCWGLIYDLIASLSPGAFAFHAAPKDQVPHSPDIVYFSFATLTTLGYGDITPVHPVARAFVVLEAFVGQLYPATLLARLVSLEVTHRERVRRGERDDERW